MVKIIARNRNVSKQMSDYLTQIKTTVYEKCGFEVSNFKVEKEGSAYSACQFTLNGLNIINRNAKITPKKIGQFVTFWKRMGDGQIAPFNEKDSIDFYTVNARTKNRFGQFVFTQAILIKKGIISTSRKEGKRAFRVYPPWDFPENKQAEQTQKWQLEYFYEIGNATDLKKVIELYKT